MAEQSFQSKPHIVNSALLIVFLFMQMSNVRLL